MPSGAKKRKAAKKKQQQASSTQINLNSNNHESRSQGERESDDGVSSQENYKKAGVPGEDAVRDADERIEITDSSHDHDKSSSSSGSGSGNSSSSDDESQEVKMKDGNEETGESVPIAGDTPFIGSTANVIVENTGLVDSTTTSDPNTESIIEISSVDAIVSSEPLESSLPEPVESSALVSDEIKQASSSTSRSDEKENERKTLTLPESNCATEGSKESEVSITHEEEAPVRPTHGVAQRTSWLSCCGLFDVMTGSSR